MSCSEVEARSRTGHFCEGRARRSVCARSYRYRLGLRPRFRNTSKDRKIKLQRFCVRARIQPHRLQLPRARPAPRAPPARHARTRTARTRAVKERQSRRTGGVWRTHLRTAPGPARPLARPCPGTRGKTLLLSVFHHAHVSHVMLRCLVRDRVKTEINNRINSICVKCRTRVRCSSTLYVSISSASSFKCQHSCGGYYYWS